MKLRLIALAGAATTALALAIAPLAFSGEHAVMAPKPVKDETATPGNHSETIVLSGGCFWGVQGVYQHVKGVTRAEAGYAGGEAATAHYEQVSEGDTGHAESVQVTFDPSVVSLGTILQIYFSVVADPTTLNYQGPDQGTQYRTDIFTTSGQQADVAKAYIAQLDGAHVYAAPIVTRVDTLPAFYPAEAHHQNYLTLNPDSGYIAYNDLPKVEALKAEFPALYSETPTQIKVADSAE